MATKKLKLKPMVQVNFMIPPELKERMLVEMQRLGLVHHGDWANVCRDALAAHADKLKRMRRYR